MTTLSVLRRLLFIALLTLLAVPAGAGAQLRIGAAFSQTGNASSYGPQQALGARLAVEQLNAAGGVLGQPVTIDVRDDASTPATAEAVFTELTGGGANALLGPTLTGSALRADPVAQARGVPVIGVSNTGDGIVEIGDYVFRDSLPERSVQPVTVRVAKRLYGLRRVAIVWATPDAFSKTGAEVFRASLKAQGVKVVSDRSFATADPAALRTAIAAAAKARPQALVISALAPDSVAAMKAARRTKALSKVPFIGGNAFNAPSLIRDAGKAAEGALNGASWFIDLPTPGNADFVRTYRARFGKPPDQFAAQAFAGVKLFAEAARRAGSADPAAVRTALAGIRGFPTVLGSFSFDAGRNPDYDPVVVRIEDGRYERVSVR